MYHSTVSNPLLSPAKGSGPRRSMSVLSWQGSSMQKLFSTHKSKRTIVPSQSHSDIKVTKLYKKFTKAKKEAAEPIEEEKSDDEASYNQSLSDRDDASNRVSQDDALLSEGSNPVATPAFVSQREPAVYYNGLLNTLDQFPEQKLAWIEGPPPNAAAIQDDLFSGGVYKASNKPIVLRKPHFKNQVFGQPRLMEKPKAMFYLRVLNVVIPTSAKSHQYRCTVQIHDQLCAGSYVNSIKNGKQSSQADLDHIFMLEMDKPSMVSLRIDVKAPRKLLAGNKRRKDITVGQQDFALSLKPFDKQVRCISFQHEQETYQVTIVYGSYMNENAQILISNERLYADFLTLYIRGAMFPRWQRYWAVLHASKLELYDFEYKETRAPHASVPLDALQRVFRPKMTLDDEEMVDVGKLGLALQFMPQVLIHQSKTVADGSRNRARMYVLPDHAESGTQWEDHLAYAAALIDEFRPDGHFTKDTSALKDVLIPLKYLW
ncbi:hypothetical protein BC940DRAFT_370518, partial [Gongronella butleri]